MTARESRLWRTLGEMYGSSLASQYGDTMPSVWQQAVRRLKDDEIRQGLAKIAKTSPTFPPNLPTFVKACRGDQGTLHARIAETEAARLTGPRERGMPYDAPPGYRRSDLYHALMAVASRVQVAEQIRGADEKLVAWEIERALQTQAKAAGVDWPPCEPATGTNPLAQVHWFNRTADAIEAAQ